MGKPPPAPPYPGSDDHGHMSIFRSLLERGFFLSSSTELAGWGPACFSGPSNCTAVLGPTHLAHGQS